MYFVKKLIEKSYIKYVSMNIWRTVVWKTKLLTMDFLGGRNMECMLLIHSLMFWVFMNIFYNIENGFFICSLFQEIFVRCVVLSSKFCMARQYSDLIFCLLFYSYFLTSVWIMGKYLYTTSQICHMSSSMHRSRNHLIWGLKHFYT